MTARPDQLQALLADLQHVAAPQSGADQLSVRAVLDVYAHAVAELRAIAQEARGRIEQSAAVVAEAREFARRRRRRGHKLAGR